MADFGKSLKGIWMKGMEAIGNTANSIAANTKFKVDEMNMLNRRTEILTDFGNKAYALFLKGEKFPEELEKQLTELSELDEKLNSLRAEHITSLRTDDKQEETEKAEAAEEETEEAEAEDEGEAGEEAEEAETTETEEEAAEEDAGTAEEEKDEPVPVIRADQPEEPAKADEGIQFSDAINDLFEKVPSTEEIGKKVDSALDSLQENLQQFGKQISDGIDELTDKLNGPKE